MPVAALARFEVAGIPVQVGKKAIKNLHLSVLPPDGTVRVSAPESLSDASIQMFVRAKIGWIRRQQEKFAEQPRQTARHFVSGETLYVWGRQYYLQVEHGGRANALTLSGDKAILTVRRESTAARREAFVNEWYRALLKAEIAKRLPLWEARAGLSCSSWQTRYMTTRWGTCNPATGTIRLNLQLAKKPFVCLDYILLHELAHLKVKNHGKEFVAILDAHMPYWREIRRELNDAVLDYLPARTK